MSLSRYSQTLYSKAFSLKASLQWEHVGLLFTGLLGLYSLLVIHRLYFHPLASFRGPRLAALSTWWIYSVHRSGNPDEILNELHRKYNTSALRIGPNEIHISDSSHFHTLYSQDHTYLKHEYFYNAFGTPHSVFVESDRNLHRQRRKMLNNFFSKSSIRGMEHLLYQKVDTLCKVLSEKADKGPLNIYNASRCMTVDIISYLAFGQSLGLMDDVKGNDFNADFLQVFDLVAESIWDLMYLPTLRALLKNIPERLTLLIGGPTAYMARFTKTIQAIVNDFRRTKADGKPLDRQVVFDELVELDNREMVAEATDIITAGSDTTATTLAIALYELTNNQKIYSTLKNEIRQAKLSTQEDYSLKALEQLPFLFACVKESLRFASAAPGRLPRIVPPTSSKTGPLVVDKKCIPPGTIVSLSLITVNFDEEIWGKDAKQFEPKRWLSPEAKQLEKYLVTFSKGSRQCLGINLAYAELTLALAMFVNRFDFEKDETMTKHDLQTFDGFTAGFRGSGPRFKISVI